MNIKGSQKVQLRMEKSEKFKLLYFFLVIKLFSSFFIIVL